MNISYINFLTDFMLCFLFIFLGIICIIGRHSVILGRMYCFKSSLQNQQLLRAYALKHCYEESRVFQKSKVSTPIQHLVGNCIIIRRGRIRNQSDFGYKEELKTHVLKKIFFVYLETTEDLIAFLWKHTQEKDIQFGLLLVEDLQLYFGEHFQHRECGPAFLIFMKLLKMLAIKLRVKGRVGFTLAYREEVFNKAHFEEFLRSEDATDWEISQGEVLKNGQRYESEQTRLFYTQYGTQMEPIKPRNGDRTQAQQ